MSQNRVVQDFRDEKLFDESFWHDFVKTKTVSFRVSERNPTGGIFPKSQIFIFEHFPKPCFPGLQKVLGQHGFGFFRTRVCEQHKTERFRTAEKTILQCAFFCTKVAPLKRSRKIDHFHCRHAHFSTDRSKATIK